MLVPFDALSKSSKVWIYQANRELSDDEIARVKSKLEKFLTNWQSHGKDLVTSYKIAYNQFIILAVDEEKTNSSGCSVDASVAVIKELEQDLQVDLFNRMLVTFKIGDNVNTVNLNDFKRYINEGKIEEETIVFNNLIKNVAELESNWEVPVKNSWHKRMV
jgi:hypothetical protein